MQRQLLRKLGAEQPQAEQRLAGGAMSLHRALWPTSCSDRRPEAKELQKHAQGPSSIKCSSLPTRPGHDLQDSSVQDRRLTRRHMRARRHSGSRSHVPCLPRQRRTRRVLVAGRVDDPSQLQARHRLHGIPEHQRADSASRKHHPHHWQGYVVNRAEHLLLESDFTKRHANMRAGRKCHKRE